MLDPSKFHFLLIFQVYFLPSSLSMSGFYLTIQATRVVVIEHPDDIFFFIHNSRNIDIWDIF